MALNVRAVAISCACLMAIAFAFYIVSNTVQEWGYQENQLGKSTFGLWRTCHTDPIFSLTECRDRPIRCHELIPTPVCKKIPVAQAFVTAACVISGLCAVCLFICGAMHAEPNRVLLIISKILLIACFIVGFIGVAVGIAFLTDSLFQYKIAVSAILGIVAVIINAITAVLAMILV